MPKIVLLLLACSKVKVKLRAQRSKSRSWVKVKDQGQCGLSMDCQLSAGCRIQQRILRVIYSTLSYQSKVFVCVPVITVDQWAYSGNRVQWRANPALFKSKSSQIFKSKSGCLKKPKSNPLGFRKLSNPPIWRGFGLFQTTRFGFKYLTGFGFEHRCICPPLPPPLTPLESYTYSAVVVDIIFSSFLHRS